MGLCAWGITDEGEKVLLHLSPGTKEDTASCTAFFQDLKRRGLEDPLLVVPDGAPGLIRAVEEYFPRAERQRALLARAKSGYSGAHTVQRGAHFRFYAFQLRRCFVGLFARCFAAF